MHQAEAESKKKLHNQEYLLKKDDLTIENLRVSQKLDQDQILRLKN